MIVLITLSPMTTTCHWDCIHHWTFTPQPLIFAIWRVERCLPWGGEILFVGIGLKLYQRRSYPEVTFPIFIFHPCDQTLPFPSILLSSYQNYRQSNYQLLYQNQARNKINKFHFILKVDYVPIVGNYWAPYIVGIVTSSSSSGGWILVFS